MKHVDWLLVGLLVLASLVAAWQVWHERRRAKQPQHRHTRRNVIISWGPPYSEFLNWRVTDKELEWEKGQSSFERQYHRAKSNFEKISLAIQQVTASGVKATEAVRQMQKALEDMNKYHKGPRLRLIKGATKWE